MPETIRQPAPRTLLRTAKTNEMNRLVWFDHVLNRIVGTALAATLNTSTTTLQNGAVFKRPFITTRSYGQSSSFCLI